MLKRLSIGGYKSLADVELDLGGVNILVGANASGKSAVLDALRFLSNALQGDLETEVNARGGFDELCFAGASEKQIRIAFEYFVPDPAVPRSRSDMAYSLVIMQNPNNENRPGARLEELRIKRSRNERRAKKIFFHNEWGKDTLPATRKALANRSTSTGDPSILALKALGFLDEFPRIKALRAFVAGWQFLQVNLVELRKPRRDEKATVLKNDASNLTNVLRTLSASSSEKYKAILEDLQTVMLKVQEIEPRAEHGRVMLFLREAYFPDRLFDAEAISDGTLRLLALTTALRLMPEHGLLCIEEPEHGIHPLVFGPLLDLIREQCSEETKRQVIVTSHSPDLLDASKPDEVVVTDRQEDGATRARRLTGDELKEWISDFRLGELWRMRHLGGVPR